MNEEVDIIIETVQEEMQQSITHLTNEFANIRAGKASPIMLKSVMVDYYGSNTPLSQVANVNTPDAQTIYVQPWEKTMLGAIEKAIMDANLGFNPMNNGESIIINVPSLTEERRIELAKRAKSEAEKAKVSIRNHRKEANDELKNADLSEDLLKNCEESVQNLTNKFTKVIDELFQTKEAEIMKV